MKQGQGVTSFLKIFSIVVIALIIFMAILIFIAAKNITPIARRLINRELHYQRASFNPASLEISLDNLTLGIDIDNTFFSVSKITARLSIRDIVRGKLRFSSIAAESPVLKVYRTVDGKFVFPDFISPEKIKGSTQFNIISGSSFENIKVSNGRVVSDNGLVILDELVISIPGFRPDNIKVEPVISGKLYNNVFRISGNSEVKQDLIINTFAADLSKFKLLDIYNLFNFSLPYTISSGELSGTIYFKHISKKGRVNWSVGGTISLRNLSIVEGVERSRFLKNIEGELKGFNYNGTDNLFSAEMINVRKGEWHHQIKIPNKTVKSLKSQEPFFYKIEMLALSNIDLRYIDELTDFSETLRVESLKISSLSNIRSGLSDVILKIRGNRFDELVLNGQINQADGVYILNSGTLRKLTLDGYRPLLKRITTVRGGLIDINKLSGSLDRNGFQFNTEVDLRSLVIPGKNTEIYIDRLWCQIERERDGSLIAGQVIVSELDPAIPNIRNISFSINGKPEGYRMGVVKKRSGLIGSVDEKQMQSYIMDDFLTVTNIKISALHDGRSLSIESDSIDMNVKATIDSEPTLQFAGSAEMSINGLLLRADQRIGLKIDRAKLTIKKINFFPMDIFISEGTINSPLISAGVKADNSFELFSFLEPFKKSKPASNITEIRSMDNKFTINKLNIADGTIVFNDRTTAPNFLATVDKIEGVIQDFPSVTQSTGRYLLSGKYDGLTDVYLDGTINPSGHKLKISCSDLKLPGLSSYFIRYLGNEVISGSSNINMDVRIDNKGFSVDNSIELYSVSAKKINGNINLERLLRIIEDSSGVIKLNIPIKSIDGDIKVDYRKNFFDLFMQSIDKPVAGVSGVVGFIPDNIYDIILFKDGMSEIQSIDGVFSDKIVSSFNVKSKYFLIESFVDQKTDRDEIRNSKFMRVYDLYSIQAKDQRPALIEVYRHFDMVFNYDYLSDNEFKKSIIENIKLDYSDYTNLSQKRSEEIAKVITSIYGVDEKRIIIRIPKEVNNNNLVEGYSNNLGVVRSGEKK